MSYLDNNITLIWLNTTRNEDNDVYRNTRDQLQKISQHQKTFVDSNECISYMKTVGETKILLIIAETFVDNVLQQIDALETVLCIFIVCNREHYDEYMQRKYPTNVVTIPTQEDSLVQLVQCRTRLEIEEATFSIFDEDEKSARDFKAEFPSFLWSRLFIDVLRPFPNDREQSMKEMLDVCRERYRNSRVDLEEIEKFCTTYEKDKNAINWYTRSNFIHRILNAALRTGNIDYLYYFRFFISDLCEQLRQKRLKNPDNLTLYRGQRITKSEIDRFKQNIGSLIAINGFLSTSRKRAIATFFLRQRLSELSPIQSVLFEITTDASFKSVIYADIQHLSEITDECEVLFTLLSVFQIQEVYFDDKVLKVWIIKMSSRNEKSTIVQKYIDAVKNEYKELSTDVIYPHLLITMDELAKAESYINRMLSTTAENTLENAALLVEMGYIHIRRHEYRKAQEVFNRVYATRKELLRENDTRIARSLNDLATVFSFVSNIKEAIECNEKALSIDKEAFRTDHVSVSKDLIYLGQNYEAIDKLDKALAYFDKAHQMQKRLFGLHTEHPNIATTLLNIGLIHTKKSDYQHARTCFMEALRIYENTLPCGHDQTIKVFLAIVDSYIGKKDFRSASEFCETKLKQYQLNLGLNHPCMGKIRKLMGYIAFKNDNYEDAFILFEEALQLLNEYKVYENESILDCLKYLAETEKYRNNYDRALIYLGKAYKIQLNIYLPNQPQIAHTLRQVGLIHMHFKIYDRAAKYLNNALEMFGINFKNDHDDVKITLEHLRRVNQILRRY